MKKLVLGFVIGVSLTGFLPATKGDAPFRLIYLSEKGPNIVTPDDVLSKVASLPEAGMAQVPLVLTAGMSVGAAVISGSEPPHRHELSDLAVLVWKGKGEMRLGQDRIGVRRGDLVIIPRGLIHRFRNDNRQLSVGLAIFSPPLKKGDFVEVKE